ncbi:DMT family transporter [Breoghania sp. L-A4]|uniref:DMT family transporter n=1 Tax=Breoghania sp. L-A4 TaxID=2304600 RepID=UPI000E35EED0|nr:DMT family transporter [Breoghania sp. L-A4]AXS42032.1 DMT family transporter [Breoghania sp. L-A4]
MSLSSAVVRLTPILFVLLWSTGFIGSKLGAPYSEPLTFLVLRYIAVLVVLGGSMLAMRPARGMSVSDCLHAMVVGVLIHGVYLGAVFWAIDHDMPAGVAALIVGLQPVVTALFAGVLLGERITAKHWIGMALGLIGITLVLGPKAGVAGAGIDAATVGVCATGVLGITLGTIYQKRFAQQMDMRGGVTFQYVGAFIVTLAAALVLEDFQVEWSGQFLFALGWLVLVLSIGAVTLLMMLIRKGAVSKVATLFYLVPAATAVESYFLFGEELGIVQLVGMAIVIGAVALASRTPAAAPPATTT